eukprot:gene23259-24648_t
MPVVTDIFATTNACMKPAPSQTSEQAVLQLAHQRQLLRARDLLEHGLPTITLTRLVSTGKLERIARGVYSLPNQSVSENHSLAEAAIRVPRGVICLLSALRVHDIGTQAPFEPSLRVVRMSGQALTEGIEEMTFDGVTVPVFNPAKTIADCFKFRNKIGLDVALEALREGWHKRRPT